MEVVELGLGVVFDLLHGGGVIFEGLVALKLHADDLLAEHVDRVLLILGQLLALRLEIVVFVAQKRDLLLLRLDLLAELVQQAVVGYSHLLPLLVGLVQVLPVLRLQSLDGVVELELAFSLDGEDLVLQLRDQVLKCVLCIFMRLELLLVALQQEGYLLVLLPQGFVEVVYLFEESLLDGLSQPAYVADPVLGLIDELGACLAGVFFVTDVGLAELILE